MEADLFNARDLAALLAIRQALDDGRLSGRNLLAAFVAAGLMGASDDPSPTARNGHAQRAA